MPRRIALSALVCAVVFSLTLATASATSAKAFHRTVTNTTYIITGSTAQELRDDMIAKGPYPWFGETTDQVDDTFRMIILTNGRCASTKIHVNVAVTYLLPSWTPPAGVDQELVDKYDTFHAGLTRHEHGHGTIAINGAKKMLKAMQGVGSQRTCEKLNKLLTKMVNAHIARINKHEAAYDVRTQHGMTQGATFDV